MKNNYSNTFSESGRIILIHSALFLFFTFLVYYFFKGNFYFETEMLMQWDTRWYASIKDMGYVFVENSQNNTGFFPLFPYFWRLTNFGPLGISLANLVLFIFSFFLLTDTFKPSKRTQYLFLSIPCFLFFMVPYSESLFFLFSTLILIGLKKNNWLLTIVAFVLATFTRSAGTIFIPALIGSFIFVSDSSNIKKTALEYTLYIAASVAATFAVIYIQFIQTGVWFAATKTHKYWNHSLRIPEIPFASWGNTEILRLDGTSLLIGLTALFILFTLFISKIKRNYQETGKDYLFSLLYLGGISMSILLFQGGDLHSLNRYIFATPFYFIFLLEFEKKRFIQKEVLIGFLLLIAFWFLFGSYRHIVTFLDYTLMSVLLAIFLLIYSPWEKISKWSFLLVYVCSTFCQAYFFVRYLKGVWIG